MKEESQHRDFKPVTQLPVYKKAVDIFALCRKSVSLLNPETGILELERTGLRRHRLSSRMLTASLGLAPSIALVETSPDPVSRIRGLKALHKATARLLKYCKALEASKEGSREYLVSLANEVQAFRELQASWTSRLREMN